MNQLSLRLPITGSRRMGNTFVIQVWLLTEGKGWGYIEKWRGESVWAAIHNFIKIKLDNENRCVVLEWR